MLLLRLHGQRVVSFNAAFSHLRLRRFTDRGCYRKSESQESYGGYAVKSRHENSDDRQHGEGSYSPYYHQRVKSISLPDYDQPERQRLGWSDGHILNECKEKERPCTYWDVGSLGVDLETWMRYPLNCIKYATYLGVWALRTFKSSRYYPV